MLTFAYNKNDYDFFKDFMLESQENSFSPDYEVIENDDEFEIDLILPGFKRKDLSIGIDDHILKVVGEKKKKDKTKFLKISNNYGKFEKSFDLKENNIDYEKVSSSFNDGILSIVLPKNEEAKNKKFAIEIS